jgi:hypothetical protein
MTRISALLRHWLWLHQPQVQLAATKRLPID